MFDRFTYLSGSDSLFVGCPSLHQTKAFKHSLLLQYRAQRASSLICGYYSFTSFKSLLETHASMSIFPQASSISFLKFYWGYRCFSWSSLSTPLRMLYPHLTSSIGHVLLNKLSLTSIWTPLGSKTPISSLDFWLQPILYSFYLITLPDHF